MSSTALNLSGSTTLKLCINFLVAVEIGMWRQSEQRNGSDDEAITKPALNLAWQQSRLGKCIRRATFAHKFDAFSQVRNMY